jgi:hypothetical protein
LFFVVNYVILNFVVYLVEFMHKAKVRLELDARMFQSRYHEEPRLNKEIPADYEKRTWKSRLHTNEAGMVLVTAGMLKNSLSGAAKFLGLQIPGKGKSTYTKHFEAGVMVLDDSVLPIHKDQTFSEALFLPADGQRGGGRRVVKVMPFVPPGLQFDAEYLIVDDTITEEVFRVHLKSAGQLIGIGAFRPRNNGTSGRYHIVNLDWSEFNG